MMTVKDFLQLSIIKDFSVVAGSHALYKPIQTVEILDFEFADGIQQVRDTIFNPHSIVLSSLLFANQNPERLVDMIKKLIDLKVSALAYKPVIFKDLPDEVLAFADEQNFPILRFGGDEFFEDIILEAVNHIKKSDYTLFLNNMVKHLIEEDISTEKIQSFLLQVNKPLEQYVFAASIQMRQAESDEWMQSFYRLDSLLKSGVISAYKQSVLIIFTERNERLLFDSLLKEWMAIYAIPSDALTIGYSQAHPTHTGLHLAVREAYYARIMAEIERSPAYYYQQLASDQLLIELYRKDTQFANDYVKRYLGALLEEKADQDLLRTAITFILKKGNVKEVAAAHHCHPNTIRYRMTKIRQLVEPFSNDLVFYEHLSSAVKLYLLHQAIESTAAVLESVQK